MQALGKVPADEFLEQLADRCYEYHPVPARLAGRAAVITSARRAVAAAQDRGYTSRAEISRWHSMTLWFGHRFARDPQLPWVAEWLTDPAKPAKLAGAQLVALDFLDRIAGLHNRNHLRALRAADGLRPSGFQAAEAALPRALADWIAPIWPAKTAAVGAPAVANFVESALGRARAHGLTDPPAAALFAAVGWFLGSYFDEDPLFPWAAQALREPSAERATALDRGVRRYLQAALAAYAGAAPAEAEALCP